jgi:acetyltransferase EpsM
MKKLILVGGGGHGKVVLDVMMAQGEYMLAGIGDDKYTQTFTHNGVPYGSIDNMVELLKDDDYQLFIAIGSNRSRHAVMKRIGFPESKYAVLIHPRATIGNGVTIGRGSVVMAGAVINYGAQIGNHCIINTGAIIEHENTIDSFAHISPSAALGGDVTIEVGVHIGIGAKVIEGKTIGAWSTLGAGAVAITDIPDQCTAVGVPAKPIKYVEDDKLRQRRA